MAIKAFQMRVRKISSLKKKDPWGNVSYTFCFEATNPYTGRYYSRWDDDAPWKNRDEEDEEEEDIDEYAPLRKEEYDYWCNGWNGTSIP